MSNNLNSAKAMYEQLVISEVSSYHISKMISTNLGAKLVSIDLPNPSIFSNVCIFDPMAKVSITWENNKTTSFFSSKIPAKVM